MTLDLEQARLRAAVLKAAGEAIHHADRAMRHAMHNRITYSDKRCRKAFLSLINAGVALREWRRIR